MTYFDGAHTSRQYDSNFSQLTSMIDELGRKTVFSVNATNGNTEEARIVVGLDDRTSSEKNDVVTQYAYTADGLVSQVIQLRNDVDGSPQLSLVTQYYYTNTNSTVGTSHNTRRWDATVYGGDNPSVAGVSLVNQSTISVEERDDYDNPTIVGDELDRFTFYTYDVLDRLILESTDDPGFGQLVAAIENDYSLGGRLMAQSIGTCTLPGLFTMSFTGAASSPMTDEYGYTQCDCPDYESLDCYGQPMHTNESNNPDGTQKSSTGPDGRTTANDFGPSPSAPVRQELGPVGFDSFASSTSEGLASLTASTPGISDVLYLYNARNELIATCDGAGVLTRYEYDPRGRLIRTVTGEGSTSERTYNAAGELTASGEPPASPTTTPAG